MRKGFRIKKNFILSVDVMQTEGTCWRFVCDWEDFFVSLFSFLSCWRQRPWDERMKTPAEPTTYSSDIRTPFPCLFQLATLPRRRESPPHPRTPALPSNAAASDTEITLPACTEVKHMGIWIFFALIWGIRSCFNFPLGNKYVSPCPEAVLSAQQQLWHCCCALSCHMSHCHLLTRRSFPH